MAARTARAYRDHTITVGLRIGHLDLAGDLNIRLAGAWTHISQPWASAIDLQPLRANDVDARMPGGGYADVVRYSCGSWVGFGPVPGMGSRRLFKVAPNVSTGFFAGSVTSVSVYPPRHDRSISACQLTDL